MALLISVPIDSYFWQKPIWPELWGFYFNAVLGSSSAWGVSPWHYYFTSALPRLLVNPLVPLLFIPLAVVQPATRSTARRLIVPCLAFVAIYSLQPHKEARFIFYVVPPLTAAAAQGANYIFARRSKSLLFAAASSLIVISVILSFAASTGMLLVSSLNYPGGEALAYLRSHNDEFDYHLTPQHLGTSDSDLNVKSGGTTQIRVHADVLSCMTGVTLFGASSGKASVSNTSTVIDDRGRQVPGERVPLRNLVLDKTENSPLLGEPIFWVQFDYVLAEDPTTVRGGDWHELGVVEGYAGVEILRPGTGDDVENAEKKENVVGKGALVAAVRDRVRAVTGGWWVGPKMVPRIHILRRAKAWRGGQDSHRVAYGGV
jgi:alpha-1,6-mannosyltransferase